MNTKTISLTVVTLLSACVCLNAQEAKSLFNGKNMAGWTGYGGDASKNWKVEDGIMYCTGQPGATWIYADKEYSDFELSLEFNLPKNANSGVFIRAPKTGDPWVTGIEIQLLDDEGDKWEGLQPDQYTGSVYAALGPSKRVTKKAGLWQSMKIRCVESLCEVWVNKQKVISTDLETLAKKFEKKIPGLKRSSGLIGLQNHGDKVSFRNIEIKEIKK